MEGSTPESYVQPTIQLTQDDCLVLSPTLADILNDDRILRFYQCVKDIKTQNEPNQTAAMFFALCHALGDSVPFLKVPNMSKIMFRQEQQIFAVNVAGTQQQDTVHIFQQDHSLPLDHLKIQTNADLLQDVDSSHTSNLFSAVAADSSSQHLLQAALASVTSHVEQVMPNTNSKKRMYEIKDGSAKRTKKASPRDKEYAVRRNGVIQDLLKVSEADLLHQANIVDEDTKLIIQGHERSTKIGMLSPLHRFSALANLPAHHDCDFAPKNAGIYYSFEYFQLYLAYRDLEAERQQQQQLDLETGDPRPVLAQVRTDIEKVLLNTNWEAIRRRLTIGERICQVCGVVGRGFLLLSKQVSGRKLLHNFNTGEWAEFMREFHKPENQPLLQTLQTKYLPERFYGVRPFDLSHGLSHTHLSSSDLMVESIVKSELIHQLENDSPSTVMTGDSFSQIASQIDSDDSAAAVAAVVAVVAAVVGNSTPGTPESIHTIEHQSPPLV